MLGLCWVLVKLLGPDHDHEVAPVAAPVRVSVEPEHTGFGDAVALTDVGVVFTVTTAVVAVTVPHELIADNV